MPRTRIDLHAVTQWISAAALSHPDDLARHLCERLGCSRSSARKALQRLVSLQWLVREGSLARPHYRPGALRQVVRRYLLSGLEEDLPWSRDFAPCFQLPRHVGRMAQHAFTELLNNAIDHSGGTSVTVSMRQTPTHLQLLVSDDGRGVFDKIQEAFDIADPAVAALELSKGKLTTQPERHTGRGLFFTSRLADVFDLHANERAFQQRSWQPEPWIRERPQQRQGSSIFVAIALDTRRTLDEVLKGFSADGHGYGFDRTIVPLRLLTSADAGLESRAQARRAASRLEAFRQAQVDFTGVEDVGHAFADELFRVFGGRHPNLKMVPINMSARVAALVESVAGC